LKPIQNKLFYYFYNDYPSIEFAIPAIAVIYAFGKVFVGEWLKGKISGWKIAGVLYLLICVIVFVAIYPSSHNHDSNHLVITSIVMTLVFKVQILFIVMIQDIHQLWIVMEMEWAAKNSK
jgi:hypothetical protein